MKIDNFALTMHQACPRKYFYRIKEQWTTMGKSAALTAGGAMHAGLAEWYRSGDLGAALLAIEAAWPENHPPDDWRTLSKCVEVMVQYSKQYPTEPWKIVGRDAGQPMVECSFTLPTGRYLSCMECGPLVAHQRHEDGYMSCACCGTPLEELEYGGIFDGLIEHGPLLYVLEHKTTSMMGKYYFSQFKPNNQISGYCWGGMELSQRRVGGAYINAIGWYKASATKFERELTNRTPSELVEWLDDVAATCEEIRAHERSSYWPKRTGSCTMYGKCEFHDVCTLLDENSKQKLLAMSYTKREWDYENRD